MISNEQIALNAEAATNGEVGLVSTCHQRMGVSSSSSIVVIVVLVLVVIR